MYHNYSNMHYFNVTIDDQKHKETYIGSFENGMRNGKAESIELTAAPPAIVATTAGSTQHNSVPDEVNKVKTLKALSFIWMPSHILLL